MKPSLLLTLAKVFAALSLVSIGGANAVVPEVRRQVVDVQHWMDERAFDHLFALANVAPGPNILLVSLVGWRVAGLAGLLVATAAIMTPSCLLAFGLGRAAARWSANPWVARIKDGLAPVAIGLVLASGVSMIRRLGEQGLATVAIGLAAAGFVLFSSRNPVWAVAASAVAAILARQGGLLP